jgi:hypothetical protein
MRYAVTIYEPSSLQIVGETPTMKFAQITVDVEAIDARHAAASGWIQALAEKRDREFESLNAPEHIRKSVHSLEVVLDGIRPSSLGQQTTQQTQEPPLEVPRPGVGRPRQKSLWTQRSVLGKGSA